MHALPFGPPILTSSPFPAIPSGPRRTSGSSALSGMITCAPLLTVWSTPWSKNWPKNVKNALYGGDRPTSVVTLGMNKVLCDGVQPGGAPGTAATAAWASTGGFALGSASTAGIAGIGSLVQGTADPVAPCVRTGFAAASTAAGLAEVWSTIRLLTT